VESIMNTYPNRDIETWEGEGGAAQDPLGIRVIPMSGTPNQVEWAERIKRQVNDEFDHVAAAFRSIGARQNGHRRADTEAIIDILETKRAEVMNRREAGYFIRDWQEITDQVRQMIVHDSRYQAISTNRPVRTRIDNRLLSQNERQGSKIGNHVGLAADSTAKAGVS
jgi:hypothetical protein